MWIGCRQSHYHPIILSGCEGGVAGPGESWRDFDTSLQVTSRIAGYKGSAWQMHKGETNVGMEYEIAGKDIIRKCKICKEMKNRLRNLRIMLRFWKKIEKLQTKMD